MNANAADYSFTDDDVSKGGGDDFLPRGTYEGTISRVKVKKNKGIVNLGFGIEITKGKHKGRLLFENYLVLARSESKFFLARRNSFLTAIGHEPGTIPPGAPGGPNVSVLEGVPIRVAVEHEYENVPGLEYSLSTSKGKKSKWVEENWEARLDENSYLVKDGDNEIIRGDDGEPEPIVPRNMLTFYSISDDFAGLNEPGSAQEADDDEEGWG